MDKKELQPFTHRIYMDFSGDDGDPKVKGSSKTLCGAWILSAEEDIHYNESIVLQIKKLIGCNRKDELKYRSLAKHKYKMQALELLSQLKVKIILTPVIKSKINEVDIRSPKTKKLIHLVHSFPLTRFLDYFSSSKMATYFQLVIDEMGWTGCYNAILEQIKTDIEGLDWDGARKDWLYFAKSGNSLMLQLADIIAGLGREYIENLDGKQFPPCRVCHSGLIKNCNIKRKGQIIGHNRLVKMVSSLLLRDTKNSFLGYGLVIRPPEVEVDYLFIECLQHK